MIDNGEIRRAQLLYEIIDGLEEKAAQGVDDTDEIMCRISKYYSDRNIEIRNKRIDILLNQKEN